MPTLTDLEDSLRDSDEQTKERLMALAAVYHRLIVAMQGPASREQYQQFTLLLEAVIQAEDIINVIYFRYHNHRINITE
ncbi:EscE/YscE/SsaE family type III secretion system needle protein co-chaperone [Yersinia aldovae]|uniref:EscE/YscE/SsaE family type III secretion system needle protein co-chaperone n=1 Tax=Yersinia aldovae TaxID=29483 RepID=UPI0005AC215E|nr:EscE/YscE/SsaE family type III secretion system needle protein co-chaperone [Yersinia aldovae]AJJ62708.1 putative secretion system protein [Yersinia aldovae 670-83]